ncbi:putative ABC transport system permease protein [Ruminococcaceae bacterium FB2012]|nr:putative ABC transport system permease protein [Ruminococcaceae bacterium FB2012]
MNRVLRKRLLRDLKSNLGRYLALVLLIVMGVFLVVSMVGSADAIIQGTDEKGKDSFVQDGQFTVFVPLTNSELEKLSEGGSVIEEQFSTDMPADDGKVLRLFKNREKNDLIQVTKGRTAQNKGEALVERRFAEVNGYDVGDKITAGGTQFEIVGLGTVPDYDAPLRKLSDTGVQSEVFGLLFVTSEEYDEITSSFSQKAQEYTYSYRLGKDVTDDALKSRIKELDFDYEKVEDKYFKESIAEFLDAKKEIEDGVSEIHSGSKELSTGLEKLDKSSTDLTSAAQKLLDSYLEQANKAVSALGIKQTLTEQNYADILNAAAKTDKTGQAASLKASLDSIAAFKKGISDYTGGVSDAAKGSGELYSGVDKMKTFTDELIKKEFVLDIDNLTSFIKAGDNARIAAAAGDVIMNKVGGLVAGVIVLILFAYVISVFVVHQIEQESSVIGSLYALGVKKKDLLRHYITMPTAVAFIGALIGTSLGFTPFGIGSQMQKSYTYFSLPDVDYVFPPYLLIYGLLMPPVISAIVNTLVINKRLNRTALSLIRSEQRAEGYRQFDIKSNNFERVFRIRHMVRELRCSVAVVLGMLISMLVIVLGFNTYSLCTDVRDRNVADTKYEYMYLYKYPEKEAPAGSEAAYVEGLNTEVMGYTLEVSVIGIEGESRYFDARPEKGSSKAIINDSLAERFGYKEGDKVTFTDPASDIDRTFTVTGIAKYSPGFTIFMDRQSMCELFGRDKDYFNAVYSDKQLDIEQGRLYSVTTKDEIKKSAGVFIDQMSSFIAMLLIAGSVIFCVVMYLMMSVMIDRSRFGISLIKIFGYRPKEIRSLYLNGNLIVVAVGGLAVIPAAKFIIDLIYPSFVANVACCMDTSYQWYAYILLYCVMMLVYLVINKLLVRKISKITPAEVLKNRE